MMPICSPDDPRRDYGGLITRVPAFVLAPRTIDELAVTVRSLRDDRVPWVVRGAGHSSGGQPLIHGGAVIDMRHLTGVIADDGETISVRAGTWWLALAEHLARDGRRPPVLTDYLRTSVGGTLAVGGIGATSHVDGLQIDSVRALTVVTPDGEIRRVRAPDEVLRFSLAGHGQLGVIGEATLSTRRRAATLAARALSFPTLADYVAMVGELAAAGTEGPWPFVRGRMFWRPGVRDTPIRAIVGSFSEDVGMAPPADLGGATAASPPELVDLLAHARRPPRHGLHSFAPCAELILPLPAGLAIWADLDQHVRASGLVADLGEGCSVAVIAPATRLPLSPAGAYPALVVALRPRFEDEVRARRAAAWLRQLSARALAAGARLYPIGEEPDDIRWARHQYDEAWPTWTALKERFDPDRLCHPWRL